MKLLGMKEGCEYVPVVLLRRKTAGAQVAVLGL
jgi:hypothetical protein